MKSAQRLSRFLFTLSLSAAVTLSGFSLPKAVSAESAVDPAPELQPAGAAIGKKVLFDNTHGQTAGSADWVINGAFSDFADALAGKGYSVKELRKQGAIEQADLEGYDVLIIPEASIPFHEAEQTVLLDYVQKGGSVLYIADRYNADRNKNRWDASEIFNGYRRGAWDNPAKGMSPEESASAAMSSVTSSDWLASHFGVRFRYNAAGDAYATDIVSSGQAFGITEGVSTLAVHGGSTLAIIDPQKAKGIAYLPAGVFKSSRAVDQGVFAGGGRSEGPLAAVAKVGAGKAGFIGSVSPAEDSTPKYLQEENGRIKITYDGFKEQDNAVLLARMVDWLAARESYASLGELNGLELDEPTPLLPEESPQASAEPQTEPWALPAPDYKWWDPATFKTGSYGAVASYEEEKKANSLYFSEYIEGTGDNRALEIYNGTGKDIDLKRYQIYQSNEPSLIGLSGVVKQGDVFVIANPKSDDSIRRKADALSPLLTFNGDDRIELWYDGNDLHDRQVIDVIGIEKVLFGSDVTLVRKGKTAGGSTSFDAEQWTRLPADTMVNLGVHSLAPDNRAPAMANPIGDAHAAAGSVWTIDAAHVFADPDGDGVTLTASSNAPAIAEVSVEGNVLHMKAASAGTAMITVTADDGNGGQTTHSFFVSITGSSSEAGQ